MRQFSAKGGGAAEAKPIPSGGTADAAAVTPGEGDLSSKMDELERQTDRSDPTDVGENLLSPEMK